MQCTNEQIAAIGASMDESTSVTSACGPNPERLKLIQAIAERLAGESASAKRWSVAVTAALLIFATRTDHPGLVLAAGIVVLVVSAVIDAYYLGAGAFPTDASTSKPPERRQTVGISAHH